MIAVDTNILVYAHRAELPKHAVARDHLTALAESSEVWAIPAFCLGEFARVITHPKLFDPPHTPAEAAEAIERLTASPSLRILNPGPRFPALFGEAIRAAAAKGNLVYDAQIVAVCRELGARTLLTEDRDFDRFPGFPTAHLAPN